MALISANGSERNNSERLLQRLQTLRWLLYIVVTRGAWGKIRERRERQRLTCIPFVMRQITTRNDAICSLMTAALLRRVRPKNIRQSTSVIPIRPRDTENKLIPEAFTIGVKGESKLTIAWDLPKNVEEITIPVQYPVVLLFTGKVQDINCSYIRSMTRACTERGWVAGVIEAEQIRTSDLQIVINTIGRRMEKGVPLYIIGYGVGAYKMVSFLGEGARSDTLHGNIAGAVAINNPIKIGSSHHEISKSGNNIAHLSVPTMIIFAEDDPQLRQNTEKVLPTMLANPNVIVVRTKGGGHASWHSSERVWRSPTEVTLDSTWANYAAAKFFDSLLSTGQPYKAGVGQVPAESNETKTPRSRL